MREMQLTPRLAAVARWIPEGCRLADVGTDHGRLPIWLLLKGKVRSVIASDLRAGPLAHAAENREKYHMTDRLELRLCGGLEGYQAHEMDVVSISGMGGETIKNILADAPWTVEKTLILQPQSQYAELRRFLQRNGYRIRREGLVRDKFLYTVMEVTGGEMAPLTPGEAYGGRMEDWEPDPQRREYLQRVIHQLSVELQGLEKSGKESDIPRREDVRAALNELKEREETLSW